MLFFSWGRRSVPLGAQQGGCQTCAGDVAQQLYFVYRYFGIFWLGTAWKKAIVGQCVGCVESYAYPEASTESMNGLVSWNYRYGWVLWASLIAVVTILNTIGGAS